MANKTRSALVVGLAAAFVLLATAEATAQYGGMPGGGMGGGMSGRRTTRMGTGADKGAPGANRRAPDSVTDIIDYRLAQLQEDLRLVREQENTWVAYEGRVKALAADITRERARAQSAELPSAVEQVNHAVDMARNRLAAWEDIATASKSLYDNLNPQQKTVADQRFPSILHELSGFSVPGDPTPRTFARPEAK